MESEPLVDSSLSEHFWKGCSLPSDLAMLVSFREVYSPASSSVMTLSCLAVAGLLLRLSLLSFTDSVNQQMGYDSTTY